MRFDIEREGRHITLHIDGNVSAKLIAEATNLAIADGQCVNLFCLISPDEYNAKPGCFSTRWEKAGTVSADGKVKLKLRLPIRPSSDGRAWGGPNQVSQSR